MVQSIAGDKSSGLEVSAIVSEDHGTSAKKGNTKCDSAGGATTQFLAVGLLFRRSSSEMRPRRAIAITDLIERIMQTALTKNASIIWQLDICPLVLWHFL